MVRPFSDCVAEHWYICRFDTVMEEFCEPRAAHWYASHCRTIANKNVVQPSPSTLSATGAIASAIPPLSSGYGIAQLAGPGLPSLEAVRHTPLETVQCSLRGQRSRTKGLRRSTTRIVEIDGEPEESRVCRQMSGHRTIRVPSAPSDVKDRASTSMNDDVVETEVETDAGSDDEPLVATAARTDGCLAGSIGVAWAPSTGNQAESGIGRRRATPDEDASDAECSDNTCRHVRRRTGKE